MIILPVFQFFLSSTYLSYVLIIGLLSGAVWKVVRG